MSESAGEFVQSMSIGLIQLGITQGYKLSDGLQFTGMDAQAIRADPLDTSKEQPLFVRKAFDNK